MPSAFKSKLVIGLSAAAAANCLASTGLPSFAMHQPAATFAARGIGALAPTESSARPVQPPFAQLSLLDLQGPAPASPEADAAIESLHRAADLDWSSSLDRDFALSSVVSLAPPARDAAKLAPAIDPANVTMQSLNVERYAPPRRTLAVFIPTVGTGSLLTAGLLCGVRTRKR